MATKEIAEFLSHFNNNSYNKYQIGRDRNLIIKVYDYLLGINIPKQDIETIIKNIAYYNTKDINLSLFLELLTKSIGFIEEYDINTIINITKEVHNLYKNKSIKMDIDEYIHSIYEDRTKKLFLDRNNKHLEKKFNTEELLSLFDSLKFACACVLDKKEYQEFIGAIEEYSKFQNTYSMVLLFKTYSNIRTHLKSEVKLFWDILLGNEYVVSLNKKGISLKEIFKENTKIVNKQTIKENVQLDIFTYLELEEKEKTIYDIKVFQLSTIYNKDQLPEYEEEKDLLLYFDSLINNTEQKNVIELPKLRESKKKYKLETTN